MQLTFLGYSWNIQGIFPYSIFLEYYFGNIPQNFIGNSSKYSGNISWECSTSIPRTYICPVDGRRPFCLLTWMIWRGSRSSWYFCIPSIVLGSAVSYGFYWPSLVLWLDPGRKIFQQCHPSYSLGVIQSIIHRCISRRWSSQMACDAAIGLWKILMTMAHTSPVHEERFQIHVDEKR